MLRQNVGKRIRTQATPMPIHKQGISPPYPRAYTRERRDLPTTPNTKGDEIARHRRAPSRYLFCRGFFLFFISSAERAEKKRFIGYRYIEERRADPISIIELRRLSSSWPGSRSAAASGGGGGFIGPIASPGASRAVLIIYTTGIKINFM